jgi:hypothetical protein
MLVVAVAAGAWVGAAVYSLYLNPELSFYRELSLVQRSWASEVEKKNPTKIVVIGGSSTIFSLMPERAWEKHGVALVNFGLAAGMGPQVMLLRGMEQVKPGDTLLLSFEPGLMTEEGIVPSLGIQYAFSEKRPNWIVAPRLGFPPISWGSALLALRPGAYHMVALAGRMVSGRPLYRYSIENADKGGWIFTPVRPFAECYPGFGSHLDLRWGPVLQALNVRARDRGVRVMYALPWAYCPSEQVIEFQRKNAQFLLLLAPYLPILHDPRLGALSAPPLFADSPQHLNREGSRLKTDDLCRRLMEGRMWTQAELKAFALLRDEPPDRKTQARQ